jgi:hypothetical protein
MALPSSDAAASLLLLHGMREAFAPANLFFECAMPVQEQRACIDNNNLCESIGCFDAHAHVGNDGVLEISGE